MSFFSPSTGEPVYDPDKDPGMINGHPINSPAGMMIRMKYMEDRLAVIEESLKIKIATDHKIPGTK